MKIQKKSTNIQNIEEHKNNKKYVYISVFLLIIIMLWIIVTSTMNVYDNQQHCKNQQNKQQTKTIR